MSSAVLEDQLRGYDSDSTKDDKENHLTVKSLLQHVKVSTPRTSIGSKRLMSITQSTAAQLVQRITRGHLARRLLASKIEYMVWAFDACLDEGSFLDEEDIGEVLRYARLGVLGPLRTFDFGIDALAHIHGDAAMPWKSFLNASSVSAVREKVLADLTA